MLESCLGNLWGESGCGSNVLCWILGVNSYSDDNILPLR